MRIIKKRTLEGYWVDHPDAKAALQAWYQLTEAATWTSLVDVRRTYPAADGVGRLTVFNLKGNRYRLVVRIEYTLHLVFIRWFGTHAEYDRGDWKHAPWNRETRVGSGFANCEDCVMNGVEYRDLLQRFLPVPIHSLEQLEETEQVIGELLTVNERTPAQDHYLELLSLVVGAWEDEHVVVPRLSGRELLAVLIEERGLRQKDLAPVLGTESIVSEVLSGKRQLNLKHVMALAEFFDVSPIAFVGEGLHPQRDTRHERVDDLLSHIDAIRST